MSIINNTKKGTASITPGGRKHTEPIPNLQQHFKYLNEPAGAVAPGAKMFDLEFKFLEERSLYTQETKYADLPCNVEKNRYPDVLPPDDTRVLLKEIPDSEGSDFINANWIKGTDGNPKAYVVTQGPMDNTLADFWRLCWEHNVHVIAMLTREVEKNQVKSARYWPDKIGPENAVPYGDVEVTLVSSETDPPELITRHLKYYNIKEPGPVREMIHFQYTGWPDHGLPPSTKQFLYLMDVVEQAQVQRGGPIGVHCSAGIGRTGTFCTVHINVQILRDHFKTNFRPPPLNIINTILLLRKQRPGMVQTKEQFLFCYKAILDEYVRLWREAKARKAALEANDGNATSTDNDPTPDSTTTHTTTTTTTDGVIANSTEPAEKADIDDIPSGAMSSDTTQKVEV